MLEKFASEGFRLVDFLPKAELPEKGRFAWSQTFIADSSDSLKARLYWAFETIYEHTARDLVKWGVTYANWLTYRLTPSVIEIPDFSDLSYGKKYQARIVGEIVPVQHGRIQVAEFIYEPRMVGVPDILEFRCGYCGHVNAISHKECNRCGAPRTKTIDEMRADGESLSFGLEKDR